ncbi:MAG: hypothetical protein AYL30_002260 [Candidatus Hecatellales archaeon B24]|nr:MAG: hypothetical protein AYL30_002260 [Candidatus Hecatellales archaeon B24]
MTFPRETAEQARRRILEMCQDHIRSVLDALREACILINAYQNGDENLVLQHYANVMGHVEKAWDVKRAIMREVAEVGELLTARDDFINLSAEINEIADYCGGVAYRMTELAKRRWKVPDAILKEVGSLAEASLNALLRLREVILALSYSTAKVMELALEVESSEKTVDSIHRKADLKIISSRMKLPVLLLIREVVEFLEDIADNAENAADIARIIAMTT